MRKIEKRNKSAWVDVTVPIKSGMVHWPGDPPVEIIRKHDIDRGDKCNVSFISMGSHTGTHMDPPFHFIASGKSLDQMPLNVGVGSARVIEIKNPVSITSDELREHGICIGERILFKTKNSMRAWATDSFVKDFIFISEEAAKYLASKKILLVGVDYLSVGGFFEDGGKIHKALLAKGIWIVEGLNLASVEAGNYDLICLPIKIKDSDGAPARAILRKIK